MPCQYCGLTARGNSEFGRLTVVPVAHFNLNLFPYASKTVVLVLVVKMFREALPGGKMNQVKEAVESAG